MNLPFLDITTITDGIEGIFDSVLNMLGDIISFVTEEGHELALVFILVPLVYIGVKVFMMLLGSSKEK